MSHRIILKLQTYKSWPKMANKFFKYMSPSGSGKTYLSQILKTKINSIIINAKTIEKFLKKY